MRKRAFLLCAVVAAILLACNPLRADDSVLTISTEDGEKGYSRPMLAAFPQHRLETHTSVTDGPQIFSGPLMRDLLADAGFDGDSVRALALNDYAVTIPTSDFERFDVIAAITMNGEELTPRDKGPVWIVYPRDDASELQDIRYDYRWVWQLDRLETP